MDGRVKWIVDGYTTTNSYPYSASRPLDEATQDTLTVNSQSVAALAPQQVNYIRNSVKATVDAYDGSVDLYAWDTEDPILQAWDNVFPTSLKPISEISGDLMSHLRYPEDMFKVQRALLTSYHVDDAREFFSGQDFWNVPRDPTVRGTGTKPYQPPYYLTLQMPGQENPAFSLMTTFIPGGNSDREILTGFLAVDAEAGSTAGVKADSYGKLRLLELPRNATVPGPGQVQNTFDSDPTVSNELNILSRGNSTVIHGNLLTLPVGGGLLYVQPVYVQASEGTKFPLLRKVLVSFGDQVGFADTLDEALNQVFGGESGASAGDAGGEVAPVIPTDGETPPPTDGTDTGTDTPAPVTENPEARAQLDQALQAASQAIKDGQAALAEGTSPPTASRRNACRPRSSPRSPQRSRWAPRPRDGCPVVAPRVIADRSDDGRRS